jgi:hypothetical protein
MSSPTRARHARAHGVEVVVDELVVVVVVDATPTTMLTLEPVSTR